MAPRLSLQTILEEIQGSDKVYFQPGQNVKMGYPAIVYAVDDLDTEYADNQPYSQTVAYQVTVIDRDPDNETWRKVGRLPLCDFNSYSVVDNLHHYYFTLYF